MTVAEKINKQEEKDRYIATKCLQEICDITHSRSFKYVQTGITDYVDLRYSMIDKDNNMLFYNLEIKERNKSEEQLIKYPVVELKKDKLTRMRLDNRDPEHFQLMYMVLLNNEKCLLFNLDKLDWSKVELFNWKIKKTQFSYNSSYTITPTYKIPFNQAEYVIDCTKYYNDYESK